jgi:hypothetical protein
MSSTDRPHPADRTEARRATGLPGLTAVLPLSGRVLQPAGPVMSATYLLDRPPAPTCNGDCPPPHHFPSVTCDPAINTACEAQFRPEVEACFKAAEPYCANPQTAHLCQQMLDECAGIYGRFCPKYVPCSPPFPTCCAGACCAGPCCSGVCCDEGEYCCGGVCCGQNGSCCWNGACTQNAPVPQALGGNQNWALSSSDCQNIQGLTVKLVVGNALVTTPAASGFSLQVNCYAPLGPGQPCYGIDWLQYVLIVANGAAWVEIQYYNNEICANYAPGTCNWTTLGLANQCGTIPNINTPWLPLGNQLQTPGGGSLQLLPNNVPASGTIPPGSVLEVALTTNTAGLVTDAKFSITINGQPSSASVHFPPNQQYGFRALVPVLVSSPGPPVNFSSGTGELSYSVSPGELCVQPQQGTAWPFCGITWSSGTAENSNAVYGAISPCCGSELQQTFSTA